MRITIGILISFCQLNFALSSTMQAYEKPQTVTIQNQTADTLFVVPVSQSLDDTVALLTSLARVEPHQSKLITYNPVLKGKTKLAIDYSAARLEQAKNYNDIARLYTKQLSRSHQTIYVIQNQGRLQALTSFERAVEQPVKKFIDSVKAYISKPIKQKIKQTHAQDMSNKIHDKKVAAIRVGNTLCDDEHKYLEKRLPRVRCALQSMLPSQSLPNNYTPIIACITSGGGFRAMPYTIGFLQAANDIGLLDTFTYISSISGSTLAVAGWLTSGEPIGIFAERMWNRMGKRSVQLKDRHELNLFISALLIKKAYGQPLTIVDIFGLTLTNLLFEDLGRLRHHITLSDQAACLAEGNYPFPIYNTVSGDARGKQEWYELTPYEIGGTWLGMYVPTWACGRKFVNGLSLAEGTEHSLGFYLGACSAAFGATIDKLYRYTKKRSQTIPLNNPLTEHIIQQIGHKRFTSAQMFNFTMGMKASPIREQKFMRMVDAGLSCNLGYPPVSGERPERKADILIFVDASRTVTGGRQLRKVEEYAKRNNLPFPAIDYAGVDERPISVFIDKHNPEVPCVIYMPCIYNKTLWETYKNNPLCTPYLSHFDSFDVSNLKKSPLSISYKESDARQIAALASCYVYASKDVLYDAITFKIKQHTP